MKAIEVNGKIKTFMTLPKNWNDGKNFYVNIKEEEAEKYGFYDVEIEGVNPLIEKLSPIYFDPKSKKFKQDAVKIKISKPLEYLKQQKVKELDESLEILLKKTDRYILNKIEFGEEVPSNIISERKSLREEAYNLKVKLNSLITKEEVVLFDLGKYKKEIK